MRAYETTTIASVADSAVNGAKASATNPAALLSAEQVLRSMASVTNITIDGSVINEYKLQQDVLSGSYNLDTVTSPMLIGVVNLAGKFCPKLIEKERAQSDLTKREVFKTLNFTVKPDALVATDYTSALQELALKIWGRQATAEELDLLNQARIDFIAGKDIAKANTSTTAALMVMVCTGMLSSFDAITL